MGRFAEASIIVTSAVVVAAIGAALFVESGFYNIGADDHHTKMVLSLITALRDRSIETRSSKVAVPNDLQATTRVVSGAKRYDTLCAECHLAPGINKSSLTSGLYPHPPNLAQHEILEADETFWVIKHGIKMSAMPAWGKSLDDNSIWDLVAFVRSLPTMTTESYQQLLQGCGATPDIS